MVLIISLEGDFSTSEVVEWLGFYDTPFLRINAEDKVEIEKIKFSERVPEILFRVNKGELINTNNITAFWYRRGDMMLQGRDKYETYIKDKELKVEVANNLVDESKTIRDLIYHLIENRTINIGSFYTRDNNKLIHLQKAKQLNLSIPNSLVCSKKSDLINFLNSNMDGIIAKPMSDGLTYYKKNKEGNVYTLFAQYVNELIDKDLSTMPDYFFPTLLQQKIIKKFELRIFYLQGKFYSMAIFSQKDEQTKTDFRRYNKSKQNYRVPFNLPAAVKTKLKRLMDEINLQTGSIDMVYSNDNKYYFLEVNPVGQFGMVSYPCNYKLEKQIALALGK